MDKILIATGNDHKYRELADEFEEFGLDLLTLDDAGITLERPEAGETYHDNARIKADEAFEKTGIPALADDSGLEVDALDGRPGVRSDRWAGQNADSQDKILYLLDKLESVPEEERSARFICEMILVDETGERLHSRGTCEGRIATEPSGEEGFGYDPVFEVEQMDWKTFGQLPEDVKNWISHRAIALNEMISQMREETLLPDPTQASTPDT